MRNRRSARRAQQRSEVNRALCGIAPTEWAAMSHTARKRLLQRVKAKINDTIAVTTPTTPTM
jgi:hypothetical protein